MPQLTANGVTADGVTANGVRLNYQVSGQGDPLLFIHGLGSSIQDWERQVPEFSRTYQVIAFDLRGHGQSEKPAGPYTLPMFAADTAGLLDALNVPAAHVVGISLGGGIAFQLALDYPTRVRTLTIVNSAPTMGLDPDQVKQEIERRVGIVEQMGMPGMGKALSVGLFPKAEQEPLRETFVRRWAENDPRAYIAATRSMLGWSVLDQIGAIQCPTLVIASDQDYSPVAVKESYIKLMPNAELAVIPDSHHAVPLEAPDRFNAVLAKFLAQHG